jgi:hypothetical protein
MLGRLPTAAVTVADTASVPLSRSSHVLVGTRHESSLRSQFQPIERNWLFCLIALAMLGRLPSAGVTVADTASVPLSRSSHVLVGTRHESSLRSHFAFCELPGHR